MISLSLAYIYILLYTSLHSRGYWNSITLSHCMVIEISMTLNKMAAFITSIAVLLSLFSLAESDTYLVMFPPETGSQTVALATAATTMLERNHTVTLLVAEDFAENVKKRMHSDKYIMETYKSSITVEVFREVQTKMTAAGLQGNIFEAIKLTSSFTALLYQQCEDLFGDQQLVKRLERQKFDLVFAHVLLPCPVLLAQHIDVPFCNCHYCNSSFAFYTYVWKPSESGHFTRNDDRVL